MAIVNRRNAIENAEDYIGKLGARFAALISMAGFPIWFAYQIQGTTSTINNTLCDNQCMGTFATSSCGALLGVVIAFIALGKVIHLIKKLNTFFFPVLICYYFYSAFFSGNICFPDELELSWPCVVAYISVLFSGMVNLPTFFQHARTKYDCYISLTLITIIIVIFQVLSIWMSPEVLKGFLFKFPTGSFYGSLVLKILNTGFVLILLICSNLVNLYFAYPSWELVIPRLKKLPKFFIIGVIATGLYVLTKVFPEIYEPVNNFNYTADDFIANLGMALVLIFLVRIIVRHRPRRMEKLISCTSWLVGCGVTLYAEMDNFSAPLLSGLWATILFFGVAFFIEEPFWSIKKLKDEIKKKKP